MSAKAQEVEAPRPPDLKALVARWAGTPGEPRPASVLRFFRAEGPSPVKKGQTPALWLGVIVQGKKRVRVGGQVLDYQPGNYLVLTGDTHFESCVIEASPTQPYLSVGVALPPELVVETWARLEQPLGPTAAPSPAWVAHLPKAIEDAVTRLVRTLDDPEEHEVLAPLILKELIYRLLRSDEAAALRRMAHSKEDEARIRRAMAHIRAHAHQRLRVADLAKLVGMSPSHFAHRFRAIAQASPVRYQKRLRLEQATHLLRSGRNVGEVADAIGYLSPAQFSRDFRAHFELAPREWARRIEQEESRPAPSRARTP